MNTQYSPSKGGNSVTAKSDLFGTITRSTKVNLPTFAHGLILKPEWLHYVPSARATLATSSWVNDPGALCCSRAIEIRSVSHKE